MQPMKRDGALARAALKAGWAAWVSGTAVFAGAASAGSFSLGNDIEVDYKVVNSYAVGMRTKNQDSNLTNGPVDQFIVIPPGDPRLQDGQTAGFHRTGLPTTINFDDGNRNFNKYALVNNRASIFAEANFKTESGGFAVSGDTFYDDVYYSRTNDNNSPDTVNKRGSPTDHFSQTARNVGGQQNRLIEAYLYANFELADEVRLNVRAGKHVVAYGESLFLLGIALSQGRADATRAFVPGAEIKEILLPTNQLSFSLGLGELTVLGYYKLEYKQNDIFPIGHYLAVQDLVGPGAEFAYGSANPASASGAGCPGFPAPLGPSEGAIPGIQGATLDPLEPGLCGNGLLATILPDAPATINVERLEDITPSPWNQFGLGLKFPVTDTTALGLYYLRYADTNPTVQLNQGFPFIGTVALTGQRLTTEIIGQAAPVSYQIRYFGDIHLTGLTFSSVVGPFNVGGEFIYRDKVPVLVQTRQSGVTAPEASLAEIAQVQLSAIYAGNPGFFYDDIAVVMETGFNHVIEVDPKLEKQGAAQVGDGKTLFNDRDSWGFQSLVLATARNVFDGFDLKSQFAYGTIIKGNPSLTAAFGSLFGQSDQRVSIGSGLQYLQNLEVGLSYNWFIGDGTRKIQDAIPQHPYSDRDFVAVNFKYSL